MRSTPGSPLTTDELAAILTRVEPGAFLVPARLLRRVIRDDHQDEFLGFQTPHRKCYVIGRERLLHLADRSELDVRADRMLPEKVILLAAPRATEIEAHDRGAMLTRCWQLLFHAAVHIELESRLAATVGPTEELRWVVQRLGQSTFDEIRTVLEQDRYLIPPESPLRTYVEFAAVYLELRHFRPALLASYFPSVRDTAQMDRLLDRDIDAAALLEHTRPPGAALPVVPPPAAASDTDEMKDDAPLGDDDPGWLGRIVQSVSRLPGGPATVEPVRRETRPEPGTRYIYRLLHKAKKAARIENTVRAAILRTAAARLATGELAAQARAAATADLDHLTDRLRVALHVGTDEASAWRRVLRAVLARAAIGFWPVEARLLYDLQRVCLDSERPVYAVDLVEWVLSLGRRPIQRPLPCERDVRMTRYLRRAASRARAARLPEPVRRTLTELLHDAVHRTEQQLRAHFRPLLRGVFEAAGLRPENFPEAVARDKLIEELLDEASERGFLRMGDVRDALSRNNLKLPEMAGPWELLRGDRLLDANRRLAVALDGVYRRGEIYLRWLQRLSAAAFATRLGRFLTRYLALPFGGAFVMLKAVEEIRNLGGELFGFEKVHLANRYTIGGLGLCLLGLLYVPAFRRVAVQAIGVVYYTGRALFYDMPRALLRLPIVRAVVQSRPVLLFRHRVFMPLLLAGLAALGLSQAGLRLPIWVSISAVIFVASFVMHSTRLGRQIDEAVSEVVVRGLRRLLGDFIPGIIRWFIDAFKILVRDVERMLYTVDEWLRFRQGQGRVALITKPIVGVFWFGLTYVIRIYINLMIEPTFNPVKHFPVVTVAGKILAPLAPKLVPVLAGSLEFLLPKAVAYPLVLINLSLVPGFFGFLVWELKENWRLYRANRPRELQPVVLGHHGETMLRLLRPGIHSGTVPKLHARIRRAERRAERTGKGRAARRHRHTLEELENNVRRFVERELLPLVHGRAELKGIHLAVTGVRAGVNRLDISVGSKDLSEEPLVLSFEFAAPWLLAGTSSPSWLKQMSVDQKRVMEDALAGLYKMAGAHLSRPAIEATLGLGQQDYAVTERALETWPGNGPGEVVYDLAERPTIHPRVTAGAVACPLRPINARELIFLLTPLLWTSWVATWSKAGQPAEPK